MIRSRGDFWSGLALAGLGAYVSAQARGWDYMTPDGPGAGFFPLWYGIAMVALSLALVGRSLVHASAGGDWRGARRALACWAAIAAAVALLKVAGFAVAFALLTWFTVAVMFRRPQRVACTVAVAGALLFYLVFDLALGVSLPAPMWH